MTGDKNADAVLRVVLTIAESIPAARRDDVRDGVQSLPFNYAFLVGQTGLDSIDVRRALEHLHYHDFLRVDFGSPRYDGSPSAYGVHVWLRVRLESVA